ncbi:MAG: hypothetical protein ACYDCC_04935 [Actinomycetota bacterium]
MRFAVEQWTPEYASPFDADASQPTGSTTATVNSEVERPMATWQPLQPPARARAARSVVFIDGVQRVDAVVWLQQEESNDSSIRGICASYAAGSVHCNDKAVIIGPTVRRVLLSPAPTEGIRTRLGRWDPKVTAGASPDDLRVSLQQCMTELEVEIARRQTEAELVVIDGPLRGRQDVPNAIGYIKTHHAEYLPPDGYRVVESLSPGERTPVFMMMTSWSRYSWYMRLPGGGRHAWAGIVRCEASSELQAPDAIALADSASLTLPGFASQEHKDSRAPQNLFPIAGLERELRHRLGDPLILYRALRSEAAA